MLTTLKHWLANTIAKQGKPWLMSSLLLAVFSYMPLAQADTQTRASAFEYDPVSGLLTKEIIEPDDPELCMVTSYTYDDYGNKTAATTRNCNGSAGSHPGQNSEAAAPAAGSLAIIATRTSSTTYDAQGRFPISSTNALGHTETKTYNSDFGTVATLTGPNNLSTTWTYDGFGKPLTENRADGTSTTTTYALCTSGCPTVGTAVAQYTVTTTQAGAPYKKSYFDMNGRAIQTETQDITGAIILTQVKFDKLGRSIATSRPFKTGTTPHWTLAEFDVLDRPTKVTTPDGTFATTAYDGYTTVTTNALNQTKTEVKNSQGQLVSVTDTNSQTLTYLYDAYGNLTQTTDALNNVTTIVYDKRGRKTAMDDPGQGIWRYEYDVLGQLQKQTDAKSQIVTFDYDQLGRMLSRHEPDLVSTWTYDTCDSNLNPGGKCIGKPVTEITDNGYERTYLYDALGRGTAELDNVDQGYGVAKTFDSYGRVVTLVYPSGNGISFSTQNVYSSSGYLQEVKETGSSTAFWQAGATDDAGRLISNTYGNGVSNNMTYDALTGRVNTISAGANNSVSNQSFVYDSIGNMTQRYDAVTNLNEAFGYDSLNRLTSTSAQAGSGPLTQVSVTYNEIGNIMSKSDIGTYTYASTRLDGKIRPHAVSQIIMNDGVTVYGNYQYDPNGNMISGAGRTMAWKSWNMPDTITGTGKNTPVGTTSSTFDFVYNASHERVKETLPDGTIVYNVSPRVDTGIHVEKRVKTSGEVSYNYSLYAGKTPFGVHIVKKATPSSAVETKNIYYHKDHLGSIIAMTDDAATVIERRSYDAWGKRRNTNGTAMHNAFYNANDVRHGFTGHEDLSEVGLIHMNGRLYDAAIGRFISADPYIQYPTSMQNYNRYSYINNNPLSVGDPSGYGFFKSVFKAVKSVFKSIKKAIKSVLKNPIVRAVVTVVAAYYGGVFAGNLFTTASTSFSGLSGLAYGIAEGAAIGFGAGLAGGFVASGGNIKAAFTSAIAGAVTGGVAGAYGPNYPISRVFANSAAGGVQARLQGRRFMDGLKSSLITSAFTYGNVLMRKAMIKDSLHIDALGRNDGTGYSKGLFGDLFKLAGGRYNPNSPVGAACSHLGCDQKGQGSIFGFKYDKGGFSDMVLESFAGPHDMANSPHFYDYNGNIKYSGLSPFLSKVQDYATNYTTSLAFAAPFATAAISEQSNYSAYRYLGRER